MQANDYLLLTDLPCVVSLYNKVYTLQYSESLTGSLFMTVADIFLDLNLSRLVLRYIRTLDLSSRFVIT